MSKKKLIITITSLCLVVVAAVAAVVAVLAAANQTVRSNISVSYSANNVKATATLAYKFQTSNQWYAPNQEADTQNDLPADVAQAGFSVVDAQRTETLSSRALQLGGDGVGENYKFNRYVIYRFSFHNDYTSQTSRWVKITLTYGTNTSGENNVILGWASQTHQYTAPNATTEPAHTDLITGWEENQSTFADGADPDVYTTTVPAAQNAEMYLAPNEYGYIYMVVAIKDVTNDASFTAADGVISFALESTAQTNVPSAEVTASQTAYQAANPQQGD